MPLLRLLLAAMLTVTISVTLTGPALASGPPGQASAPTTARVCGWGKVCVVFGSTATRRIDSAATEGMTVFAGVLCGEVPTQPRQLVLVKAVCAGVAAGYYAALRPVFARAARQGKRVEIGWRYVVTTLPTSWRVV